MPAGGLTFVDAARRHILVDALAASTCTPAAPRVAFFVHMLPRFVDDFGAWARALCESGSHVRIHAPPARGERGAWWKRPEVLRLATDRLPSSAEVVSLGFDRDRWTIRAVLGMMEQVRREARMYPGSVFVFWTAPLHLFCGAAARLLGVRAIYLVTGMGSGFGAGAPGWRRALLGAIYRWLIAPRNVRVIVHNVEDREWIARAWRKPIEHVTVTPGCGVDPSEYPTSKLPEGQETPVVYAPIRLIAEKGVHDLVEASAILHERGVVHEVWFTADVDEGNPSGLRAADLEVMRRRSPCVRFLGYQADIRPLYARASVVCIPTKYREGLPTAILEAASSGRPIVATDNIGCREFVIHEETGLVVRPGEPEDLAQELRRVLEDRALAKRLSDRAHEHFLAGFTKQIMVERSLAVVAALAPPPPGDVPS